MHKIMQFYALTGQYKRAPVVRCLSTCRPI